MTGQTKVSREFIRDFAYIANLYEWTPADIEEVKQQTRGNAELMGYWRTLAFAHRMGYQQTKENNYMRMTEWNEQRKRIQP